MQIPPFLIAVRAQIRPTSKRHQRTNAANRSVRFEELGGRCLLTAGITEFALSEQPSSAHPWIAEAVAPDGNLWFTNNATNQVSVITSGGVHRYNIPTPASNPTDITLRPDGALWFTEENVGKIGRITGDGKQLEEFSIPRFPGAAQPFPTMITEGADGALWFIEGNGLGIGRVTMAGVFSRFPTPAAIGAKEWEGIAGGSDGGIWLTVVDGSEIIRMDTTNHTTTVFSLPTGREARSIVAGQDGTMWLTDGDTGQISSNGKFTFFNSLKGTPAAAVSAHSVAAAPDGGAWFALDFNQIEYVTAAGTAQRYDVPFVADAMAIGKDGTLWTTSLVDDRLYKIQTDVLERPNLSANQTYVAQAYLDLLGRPVDNGAMVYWSNQLGGGLARGTFATSLARSDEYLETIIRPAYQHYLGRDADPQGIEFWIGQMRKGLSDEHLEADFVGSNEFYIHSGDNDKSWVDAMYLDLLGRTPDSVGEEYWVNQLTQGAVWADVAYGFAASVERERARIQDDYFHFLGRQADAAGIDYWVGAFTHGTTNEELIAGFVASDEYYKNHSGPSQQT